MFTRQVTQLMSGSLVSRFRVSAAQDENQASLCFQVLLVYLEEQWKRSVEESKLLQRPDFSGMRDYLLVGHERGICSHFLSPRRVHLSLCFFRGCNKIPFQKYLETLSRRPMQLGFNTVRMPGRGEEGSGVCQ